MFDTDGTPTQMIDSAGAHVEAVHVSPSKCEEKLVDAQRYTSVVGGLRPVCGSTMVPISVKIWPHKQVGFLKDFKGDPGDPRACTPVTALHNITQVKDHVYSRSSAIFPDNTGRVIFAEADRSAESLEVIDLASPTAELSYPWKHGVDIAWGNAIPVRDDDPVSIHIAKYSFDKVREGFQYKTGQKVGITVYSDTGATPKTAGTLDIDQERLDQIYGRRRHTHIYTGKITYVGEQHIEDDVNAFEGCSGAIVFLLNTDQPNDSGVTVKDYGTAIAVLLGVIPTR